ncbi:citrate synthase [Stackebrandtia endophytica]|uniref:Citrate synthase n=1 Tax=Stackebrandtia endophytica TaxID=1496996 RepID=A0A543B3N8_9ACTN|nr:bifunctional 2-methylcitrate synthase/citrate synthase [Stackebrandtia endophytica]TQL79449.1 citrate synthase [Stackebrandtia endophytica]
MTIHRGLNGVVVDRTAISHVDPDTNSLTYRGYPVQELVERCSFEQVAHLIWYGELPDLSQLQRFKAVERANRVLPRSLIDVLGRMPLSCHPMDVLRTAVSQIGADDPGEDANDPADHLAKAANLFAKLPTVVAVEQRRRRGLDPIPPDPSLNFAENFLHMATGRRPDAETTRAFETSLILYAEHGFNASTFTARVVTSTLSDMYSAVIAAIGALKGPLHGGANEAVLHMMEDIGDPSQVSTWLQEALDHRKLIMGFGHRVYKRGDSRVPIMRDALWRLAARHGDGARLTGIYTILAEHMLTQKNLHPNLDYPAGPAYHLMGLDTEIFTPVFVMSRITGWTAHIIEQSAGNALIRPLGHYDGSPQRTVPAPHSPS